jgi:hypothetical protein
MQVSQIPTPTSMRFILYTLQQVRSATSSGEYELRLMRQILASHCDLTGAISLDIGRPLHEYETLSVERLLQLLHDGLSYILGEEQDDQRRINHVRDVLLMQLSVELPPAPALVAVA